MVVVIEFYVIFTMRIRGSISLVPNRLVCSKGQFGRCLGRVPVLT